MFAITSATFPFLARSFARPSPSRRSTPCRRLKTSARSAVEPTDANKSSLDAMQVTLVNVSCKEGTEEAFVAASLSNASNSVEVRHASGAGVSFRAPSIVRADHVLYGKWGGILISGRSVND